MKNNNIVDHTFINKNIKNRIINYRVDNSEDEYYLLTNLTCSIDELKNLYWKRWQVEIHFKESKYNLSLKTENSLIQKIYIHNLIFILYYYFKFDIDNPLLKSKYKINNKADLGNLIYLFLFGRIFLCD